MCKQFYTNRFKLIFVSRFLFCQLPEIGHNLGCLEGAWELSGGFLSNPGQCQDAMVCKQLINIQLGSFFLDVFLHPASSDQPKCAIFWGVCRVSGGSLGCIWRTLDILRGVRIQNKLNLDILISCNIFSQWAIFGDFGPKVRNFKSDSTSERVLKSKKFQLKLALKLNFLSHSKWAGHFY